MRVLMLTADYPPENWSGLGVAVERRARALATLGLEVTVVVARPPRSSRRPQQAPTAVKEPGPLRVIELQGAHFPVDIHGFDVVHLHSLALAEMAVEIAQRASLPLIYTAHTLVERELPDSAHRRFWSSVQAHLFTQCARIVFLSRSERMAALTSKADWGSRAVVVPNGVDAPPILPSSNAGDEPQSLVFAGRFAHSKGIDLLAEVVPQVLEQHPQCRFLLAGGHGDSRGQAAVRRLLRAVPNRCQRLGWLDRAQLDQIFAGADVVLMPSRYEPFGLVALEAMRLGAPVLAADVDGLREVVGENSGGLRVTGHSPRRWTRATLDLLANEGTRQRLHRRGPDYVRRFYSNQELARRLHEVAYAA